jgi:2,3-bisphosphoglycerate-dependent phosphoglycerate mutase
MAGIEFDPTPDHIADTTIYLVRHAEAPWTPDEDRPISAQGWHDADRIAGTLGTRPIDAIYVSPYLRARQTLAPLAMRLGVPMDIRMELRERALHGPLRPVIFFERAVRKTWAKPRFAFRGGESNADAQLRAAGLLRWILAKHREQEVVLGTHGNLLALILQLFDPSVDYEFWSELTFPDVYQLAPSGGEWTRTRLWYPQDEDAGNS